MKWLSKVRAYIQGNSRSFFYNTPVLRRFIPLHILEQIDYRILVMDKECYNTGACIVCGCNTPELQMANKACPRFPVPCYPEMMDALDWVAYKYINRRIITKEE